jgi:hypothetical protein
MKIYRKEHRTQKALDRHLLKLRGRHANYRVVGMVVFYVFPRVSAKPWRVYVEDIKALNDMVKKEIKRQER